MIANHQREVRQCGSLTILMGIPASLISTAFSIFRPKLDCIQLSVAYSPITKKSVDCAKPPVEPPRDVTCSSHSAFEPKTNVPVKQKRAPSKSICGRGLHNGSTVDRIASPNSKSFDINALRSWKRSSRSSSSTMWSAKTESSRDDNRLIIGLEVTPSFATSHLCKYSTSLSDKKSSASRPRAIPTNSVTWRSSKRARLYLFKSGLDFIIRLKNKNNARSVAPTDSHFNYNMHSTEAAT